MFKKKIIFSLSLSLSVYLSCKQIMDCTYPVQPAFVMNWIISALNANILSMPMFTFFTHRLLTRNNFGVNFVPPLHSVLHCTLNPSCHFAFIEENAPQQNYQNRRDVGLAGPRSVPYYIDLQRQYIKSLNDHDEFAVRGQRERHIISLVSFALGSTPTQKLSRG